MIAVHSGARVPHLLACTTLTETFANGLADYSVWRGASTPFSASGGVLTIAQQISAVPNTIVRQLAGADINVDGFSVYFRLGTIQADDSGQMWITNTALATDPGAAALSFLPARDVVADPGQKPFIAWNGAERALGAAALSTGVWYFFECRLYEAGFVHWQITNDATGVVWGSGTAPIATAAAFAARRMGWNTDAPNTTGACEYKVGRMNDCGAIATITQVLDAATKGSSVTLSARGLVLTGVAPANGMAYSTAAHDASGDHCFEVIPGGTNDGRVMVGIVQVGANMDKYPGFDSLGRGYWGNTGEKYLNDVPSAYGATWGVGDHVLGRLNAGALSFRKNGVDQGVAYSGLTGSWRAAIGFGTSVAGTRTAFYNGGVWPFYGGTPSGSTAWG